MSTTPRVLVPDAKASSLPYTILRRYSSHSTNGGFETILVQGSVLDFRHKTGAIVNAANEGCLGGGGVDGAITAAGGKNLANDRKALPILSNLATEHAIDEGYEEQGEDDEDIVDGDYDDNGRYIRCRTGSAVLTGPGDYGDLMVPYVIHAVGPNFWMCGPREGRELLISAYQTSLDVAAATECITDVAFSLLSAGVFRARIKLRDILIGSLKAIQAWEYNQKKSKNNSLKRVYVFGFTDRECDEMVAVGDALFRRPESDNAKVGSSTAEEKLAPKSE